MIVPFTANRCKKRINQSIQFGQFSTIIEDLDSLKSEIANKTTNRITFIDIYELHDTDGRVLMFQIPAVHCVSPKRKNDTLNEKDLVNDYYVMWIRN
jgi:hypothetical protein